VGGSASSGQALATATTGNGAAGGTGGNANGGDAGSYNASNTIASGFSNAAGISVVSQNTGANALTQQGVTVQANLTIH
jgi:hypothetical protein